MYAMLANFMKHFISCYQKMLFCLQNIPNSDSARGRRNHNHATSYFKFSPKKVQPGNHLHIAHLSDSESIFFKKCAELGISQGVSHMEETVHYEGNRNACNDV